MYVQGDVLKFSHVFHRAAHWNVLMIPLREKVDVPSDLGETPGHQTPKLSPPVVELSEKS